MSTADRDPARLGAADHAQPLPEQIQILDTHTEGEPTRVVLDGWPTPTGNTMSDRATALARNHDEFRRAVILEPRGHAAVVGALLTAPIEEESDVGVIFFNNVGVLGMCGHGTIGVVEALRHLGRVGTGTVRLDTPAGTVAAELSDDGRVTIRNVVSRIYRQDVTVPVDGIGTVRGDIAYGGNWFFLAEVDTPRVAPTDIGRLISTTRSILSALHAQGITGANGAAVDHVELSGVPSGPHADARNFVLCPGGEYDRSPCGTGTSAIMVARHARGLLPLSALWRQEGIHGGVFEGWLEEGPQGELIPFIRGRAFVTGETRLHFSADDPFRTGIPG